MELFNYWMYGAMTMLALAALRVPREDVRTMFVVACAWPLTIVLVIFVISLTLIDWDFDIQKGKLFGFRRPTVGTGFAISVFFAEFQFWKVRKA